MAAPPCRQILVWLRPCHTTLQPAAIYFLNNGLIPFHLTFAFLPSLLQLSFDILISLQIYTPRLIIGIGVVLFVQFRFSHNIIVVFYFICLQFDLFLIPAMKYMIKQLETLCINYLLNNINAENVFTILQFCIDCETDSELMDTCKEFIRKKTESVLKADSFLEISHKCLTLLLEQNSLNISEVNLFEAVGFLSFRWNEFH